MRIITNAIPLMGPMTGVGNYLYHLATEFRRQRQDFDYFYYYGFFSRKLRVYRGHSGGLYRAKETVKKIPIASSVARRLKNSLTGLQLRAYDLYFEPNFIPLAIRAKRTVTAIHDFSFHLYPQWHPRDRVEYFSKNFFSNIRRSDAVITVSRFVREQALELLDIPEDRFAVIPNGYDASVFNPSGGRVPDASAPENYILFVGSVEPRKNLLRLLQAYRALPERAQREHRLLLAGFKGWENREIVELLEKLKSRVQYLGYVENEALAALYRGAACFVYPSLYEGFGLPPLEAMACGCPVVVSRAASLPEVCGEAARYVDPVDTESIAGGILEVLENGALRKDLTAKGLARARLFSWETAAADTLRVFEEAAGAPR